MTMNRQRHPGSPSPLRTQVDGTVVATDGRMCVPRSTRAREVAERGAPGVARSRKGMQTRARLVDAAERVFERDGFLEARIVDIAEAAHLAPGSWLSSR
jgi:hypothetical protein